MAVYLDHNATSPMHPEAVEAMLPFIHNPPGNSSSLHGHGCVARSTRKTARGQLAELLRCAAADAVFTSGGTQNVVGTVGLGKAAELAGLEMEQRRHYLRPLRNVFETRLADIAFRTLRSCPPGYRDWSINDQQFFKRPAIFRQAAG
jgi:cysteine sulfinate desulfinase/cysteine desulfurase-like protein